MHMGDHLFVGSTDKLLNAYYRLYYDAERYNNLHCAEQSSSLAIMDAFAVPQVNKEYFKACFDAIDVNELKPFEANWQHGNTIYRNEFHYDDVIRSIDEL